MGVSLERLFREEEDECEGCVEQNADTEKNNELIIACPACDDHQAETVEQ